jgi:hypothetical protein
LLSLIFYFLGLSQEPKPKEDSKKWFGYYNWATRCNSEFSPEVELETPTLEEVKCFEIENVFWNFGSIDHPSEPWAVDLDTKNGIQEYLEVIHCQEDLHQIAREARQAVKWAVELKNHKKLIVFMSCYRLIGEFPLVNMKNKRILMLKNFNRTWTLQLHYPTWCPPKTHPEEI